VDRLRCGLTDILQEADVVVTGGERLLLRIEQARGIAHAVGADEGHHRVQVVEGIGAGRRDRGPARRQGIPAVADIDPAQLQPPQQRRSIDHVQHQRRGAAEHALVQQRHHFVDLVQPQMEQRQVPPVVTGEEAALAPGRRVLGHPGDAVAAPVLHLQHMRHCVPAPAVTGLELDARAAERLGTHIVGGLLQAEGQHRQHRVMPGHAGVPVGLGTRDAVAQHARVAGEEVDLVAHLQRQQVQGVTDAQILQDAAGTMPLALRQCAGGRHVHGLALGGRAAGRSGMRLARRRQPGRFGAQQVQVGHQHMRHRHVR